MSELNLYFVVDGGKTRTKIGVEKNNIKINFKNDASKKLTVKFSPAGKIGKHGGGSLPNDTLELQQGQSEALKFKNSALGEFVNYTATIDGALPEDPIIIIDR